MKKKLGFLCLLTLLSSVVNAITIYYYNSNNWNQVAAYTFSPETFGGWPGKQMNLVPGHDGWYSIEVDETKTSNIIFNNNNSGSQTGNLIINAENTYYKDGWQQGFGEEAGNNDSPYYYRGGMNGWGATQMTLGDDKTYSYYYCNASSDDNARKFKIALSANGYDYNYSYVQAGFNGTDVTNIGDYGHDNCYYWDTRALYILVYHPNTSVNTTDKPIICASTTLPTTCTFPTIGGTASFITEINKNLQITGIVVTPDNCIYTWTTTAGTLKDDTSLTPVFRSATEGTYTLTLTAVTPDGCSATFDVQVTVTAPITYYIKHPFKGDNNWSWVELTPNGDGTYSLRNTYGADGCNWNTTSQDAGAKWIPQNNLGNPDGVQKGDSAIFTLDPAKGTITLTKIQPSLYPISFGVIGNVGGTLTAQSGGSIIESGQTVSSAAFTATPATGYTVEGWYRNWEATERISEAGTAQTYTMSVSQTNNQVYVKFVEVPAIYFKKNDLGWDNPYLFTFSANPWEDGKGVHPKQNRIEYGQMNKVGDDVYAYTLQQTATVQYLTFTKDNQNDYGEFYKTEAVHRGDFNTDMPLFIHERGSNYTTVNETKYYDAGIWMKYNSVLSGYYLMSLEDNRETQKAFTADVAGGFVFSAQITATAGKTYSLYLKNDRNEYFSAGNDATLYGTEAQYQLYRWDNWAEAASYVTFAPQRSGVYTLHLYLEDGKVIIGFDALPDAEYRLVYVERNAGGNVVFHPTHSVAVRRYATTDNPMCDTLSLHVRPMQKDAAGVESANTNNCEVWLQQYLPETIGEWTTISVTNVHNTDAVTGNGVYNFVIEQNGEDNPHISLIYPYTGTYYIRSDAATRRGGVGFADEDYVGNVMNRIYYSEYAKNYETFDYYYCEWVTKGTDICFTVANPYSYCLSDTLVRNNYEQENGFVGADGKLTNDANIRFMWNTYDNSLNRAYLAGAGENVQLLSKNGIYGKDNTLQTKICLQDRQNWVYRADIYASANALVKVLAPYQGHDQYFKGMAGDYSDENMYPLILGKQEGEHPYKVRVLYDFKTNHLICAWLVGGNEITADDEIETDLMIIRENHQEAEQLTFNPNVREIAKVKNAYCVLSITKDYLQSTAPAKEKSVYWVTFPFDVLLSEVFGGGLEYGNDYMIQYYDGAARAANGCWSDSPSYWKYYEETNGITLHEGAGYVVVLDWQRILSRSFTSGNTDVCLYFPSANKEPMPISGVVKTISYPSYICTIERDNRYIYDSNWNLIGAPSFANIDQLTNPQLPVDMGEHIIGFMYEYDAANSKFIVSETDPLKFNSMYSYMVQYAGDIDWMTPEAAGEIYPQAIRARRVEAKNKVATLRLTLQQNAKTLDCAYVRFQEEGASEEFDLNVDLSKQDNAGANLYTLTGSNDIRVAANVQPMPQQQKNIVVGVSIAEAGEYTFALPDGTDGLSVNLLDMEIGARTDLLLSNYTTMLQPGSFEQRFVLEIKPQQHIVTAGDNVGSDDNLIRKYIINGRLYIQKGTHLYDVQGRQVQ
ncbi:MAG: starch-binding protein [Paludibacter sp.]|nr:starch-binding protein [Bacteroides sp.]MCM1403294.1 starch-binding protein [Bacteroides sp.]MCM1442933.1 starch-binding protein [Muribaculum sp.]MCM1481744.1 starch-binding protein [Paludibacter sp.]MCM1576012.1 starch-binding protein [Bacteroides sp.]